MFIWQKNTAKLSLQQWQFIHYLHLYEVPSKLHSEMEKIAKFLMEVGVN